jgi:hypothetical protein
MFQFAARSRAGRIQAWTLSAGLLQDLPHFIVGILVAADLAAYFETASGGTDGYLAGFAMQTFHGKAILLKI